MKTYTITESQLKLAIILAQAGLKADISKEKIFEDLILGLKENNGWEFTKEELLGVVEAVIEAKDEGFSNEKIIKNMSKAWDLTDAEAA